MSLTNFAPLKEMIIQVAEALGPDLLATTAFVGGVTTGLLITDEYTRQTVRATDDVDLITSALGYVQHANFEEELRRRGFRDDAESEVICRKRLGNLKVDFMPTDESLGFTNRWYRNALAEAQDYELKPGLTIRLLTPAYFIATKLEAWNGRGEKDLLASRDLEDIFNLVNGRETLIEDISGSEPELLAWIAKEFKKLISEEDFDYLLQATTNGDVKRIDYLFDRVKKIIGLHNE
ncbi:hypothetical protein AB6T85_07285 [Erwinia sp. ACCC 02193]|uniref:Nucleotidyl transferase AbiEii/AbiGii toxin family protein n=1 Tax=Erwinia aeris TaxID=3239803 RepID=A0ABV4E5N8_9GAMM